MRQSKTFTALTMSFILLITCFTRIPVFADEKENIDAEVPVAPASEACKTLINLGIIVRESFDPAKTVTRGDFVYSAMKLFGDGYCAPSDTQFSDVTNENPTSGAIQNAANLGIISGYGDGSFGADDVLTTEQAVKIIVSVLGYDVRANSYGGYPVGYLSVAAEQGLLKKVVFGHGTECTWDAAAQLIYNALNTEVLQSKVGTDEKYFTEKGKTPMTLWLGMTELEGKIIANSITTLDGSTVCNDGYIKINDTVMLENGFDTANYIGYTVTAYCNQSATGENVLMDFSLKSNVSELTVNSENIAPETTAAVFKYYKDESSKTFSMDISPLASVVYNHKALTGIPADSVLKPENGEVRLVDTDGNHTADIVFIKNVLIYVADSISKSTGTVTDMYKHPALHLDINDTSCKIKIHKDGKEILPEDIKPKNVLEVIKSEDGLFIDVIVTSDRIKGIIDEISDDTVKVGGEIYKLAKANKPEFAKLKVGNKVTFYLTSYETVAGYGNMSAIGEEYGYLVAVEATKSGMKAGKECSFRIFSTESEKFRTFTSDPNFKINGSRSNPSGVKYEGDTIVNAFTTGGVINHQLVKYIVSDSDDSVITQILTAKDNRRNSGTEYGEDEFSYDYGFRTNSGGTSYISYKSYGIINSRFNANGSIALKVPSDTAWEQYNEGTVSLDDIEKQFKLFDTSSEWYNDYKIYSADIYDVDENNCCGVILESGFAGSSVPPLDYFLVDKAVTSIDEDGMPAKKVYGLYKGKSVCYSIAEDEAIFINVPSLKELRRGDVIRIALSSTGKICNIIKVFTVNPSLDVKYKPSEAAQGKVVSYPTADAPAGNLLKRNPYILNGDYFNEFNTGEATCDFTLAEATDWNVIARVIHARISKVNGSMLTVSPGKTSEGEIVPNKLLAISPRDSKFYVYDEAADTVSPGTADDIDPNDETQTVVIRMRYLCAYEVVIINREKAPQAPIYWVGGYTD